MGQSPEELREQIAGTRAELGDTLDAIGDRVSPGRVIERRKNRITNGFRSVKDRLMGTASDAGHAVTDRVGSAAGQAGDAGGGAVDAVRGAPTAAREQTQGNPLAAGAVAFGVGFLVAAALPKSKTEVQAAGKLLEAAEPVKAQLAEVGHEVADNLKDSAKDAVQQVKETAAEGGRQVSETAKDAAEHGKEAVQDGTDRARQEASSS